MKHWDILRTLLGREWRECADCAGTGVVYRATSAEMRDRTLRMIGWRDLGETGEMVCSTCAEARRYDHSSPTP